MISERLRITELRLLATLGFMYSMAMTLQGAPVELGKPSTITIDHPHDRVIHGYNAANIAGTELDNTGRKDVSLLLNRILETIFEQGGGTLYLPAGRYRLNQPVFVPAGTALRGDFVVPGRHPVDVSKNTVICAYYGRGMDEQADPLLLLDGSSLIDGLVIWYPEQKAEQIVPYAPTIRHFVRHAQWAINTSSRNIFLVNAYTGVQIGKRNGGTCIQLVKNLYGTPLGDGVEVWEDADIPRIVGLVFDPDYWPAAKLGERPVNKKRLQDHLIRKASGITYHRCDGSELANITIRGYHKGLKLANGHTIGNNNRRWLDNEGHYLNFKITGCQYAVWIQNIKNHGTQFYNCLLEGTVAAVYVENPTHGQECAMFMGCELRGGKAAVMQSWEDKKNSRFSLMFTACKFKSPILWTGGNLVVTDCLFDFRGSHISLGPEIGHAVITDSKFKGSPRIDNQAGNRVKMGESEKNARIHPPKYVYDENRISTYKPPKSTTAWVSTGNGRDSDVDRIQAEINRISAAGGGYVVLAPGIYTLDQPLTIKANVELRGPVQAWQHSKFISFYTVKGTPKGAVIYVEHGRDAVDDATIILEENAGMDGLFFHYPGQEYSTDTREVLHKFAWLIRMKGDRSYVKHVTASNPWRFIDLCTHRPKDAYVGYCNGAPLDQGIRVGETQNTMIDNVHFNSWYWNVVYFPNKPSEISKKTRYKEQLDNWMKANTKGFLFAGSRNVNVYGSFIFCSQRGFTLLPGETSGKGPSGIIINSGHDWSKFGLYMHANNGLSLVNIHFIVVKKYDPDPNLSSIFIAENCSDRVDLYNVSTWGSCPRAFSMRGTPESGCTVHNLSYQLYPAQDNIIAGGTAEVVSAIRNIHKLPTSVDLGPEARFNLHAGIFYSPWKVTETPESKGPKSSQGADDATDSRLTRSYSFP